VFPALCYKYLPRLPNLTIFFSPSTTMSQCLYSLHHQCPNDKLPGLSPPPPEAAHTLPLQHAHHLTPFTSTLDQYSNSCHKRVASHFPIQEGTRLCSLPPLTNTSHVYPTSPFSFFSLHHHVPMSVLTPPPCPQ